MGAWRKRLYVFLLGLAAVSMASAQPTTLRIQDYPGIAGTLVRVAIEKGYCEAHGVHCTLQVIPSAPLGVQTLMAGGIDVAQAPAEVTLQALERGSDIRIVSGAFNANLFMLVFGQKLAGQASMGYPGVVKALKGKKVGVTARGSGPEFEVRALLTAAGMSPNDVTYIAVGPPNTAYPALASGQVDAVMSFFPIDGFCDVLKTCSIALLPAKGEGPPVLTNLNGAGSLYLMRRDFMAKNAAAAQGFAAALRDAQRFVANEANTAELRAITLKYYHIDTPHGDEIVMDSIKRFRGNFATEVSQRALQAAVDYLVNTGQLQKKVDISRLF